MASFTFFSSYTSRGNFVIESYPFLAPEKEAEVDGEGVELPKELKNLL